MDMNLENKSEEKAENDHSMTSKKIMKNIIMLSVVFLLNFIAYGGLAALQSSLHLDEGMGTITQSVLYAALIISCLILPKLSAQKFGHKWVISLSLLGYITWMAANGYAVWATMIPTSILVGISASTLWTSQGSYITIMGKEYSRITGQKEEGVIALFFGIFYMFFQSSFVISSIISSTVLKQAPPENYTGPSEEELALCGINDCPDNNITNVNLQKPAENLVWTLVGIYISIAVAGFICSVVFVDKIPAHLIEQPKGRGRDTIIEGLQATVLQMKQPLQLLLIPLTIYNGLAQTFKSADWNKSFVSCNLGIWMIGYVTLPYAIVNAATSFAGGRLVRVTGRIPLFISGMCLELLLMGTYAFWSPDPDEKAIFYVIAATGGIADGLWQTQINALYGAIFTASPEAAFSNFFLWESSGFVMGYGYSSQLCTTTKLYIMLSFLTVGMILYAVVEYIARTKKKVMQHAVEPNPEMEIENTMLLVKH